MRFDFRSAFRIRILSLRIHAPASTHASTYKWIGNCEYVPGEQRLFPGLRSYETKGIYNEQVLLGAKASIVNRKLSSLPRLQHPTHFSDTNFARAFFPETVLVSRNTTKLIRLDKISDNGRSRRNSKVLALSRSQRADRLYFSRSVETPWYTMIRRENFADVDRILHEFERLMNENSAFSKADNFTTQSA